MFARRVLIMLTWIGGATTACPAVEPSPSDRNLIVVGIDGMDPRLLDQFVREGDLPHFKQLMEEGSYTPLQTTMPPLSPVAWSTFITGMDPGGHGIFDFFHRDPKTLTPYLSMSRAESPRHHLTLGSLQLPLSKGSVHTLRHGKAFWEILAEQGIPTTVFRMPVNFPPTGPVDKALSGMGTPDLLGTQGTFSWYSSDPDTWRPGDVPGGQVFTVAESNGVIQANLVGPENRLRRRRPLRVAGLESWVDQEEWIHPEMTVAFNAYIDPDRPLAKFDIQEAEFILQEGEWSDWIPVRFTSLPGLAHVSAAARFYLKQVHPHFCLYVTPLQIDPSDPVMPISEPPDWCCDLQQELGYFYTQGLAEDTKALSAGVFSPTEFRDQGHMVLAERRQALDHLLQQYQGGLLFFYFSTIDQHCHMLWRHTDNAHPGFMAEPALHQEIRNLYREMDDALGRVRARVDDDTTLIVMSDHGFAPFYWEVNLNSWLVEKGYVVLKNPAAQGRYPYFGNVDWSRTQAYALGLNGIYVNMKDREKEGVVEPGNDYQELLDRLEQDLLAFRDPDTGSNVVTQVVQTHRDYHGAHRGDGPDLIVGYGWGYRSSWTSPLGEFPRQILAPNHDPWSGDHAMDSRLVPGILLTNRKISLQQPALYDVTVAILDEFDVPPPPEMIGADCITN